MLTIEPKDLDHAVSSNIVSRAQAHALWEHLAHRSSSPRRDDTSASGVAPPARRSRFSPTHPILGGAFAVMLWCAVLALAPTLLGRAPTMSDRSLLSALIGIAFLAVGFAIDGHTRRDHTGPVYVAGLVAIVGAVATAGDQALLAHASAENVGWPAMAAVVGAALVLIGLVLRRRSFAIFGALALAGAAGQLADEMLVDAVFPFVLVAVGLALVAGALAWRRAEVRFGRAIVAHLPAPLVRVLDIRRARPAMAAADR